MTDNSGSTSWTYEPHGQVSSREQTMGGVTKTVSYGYNLAGQLESLTLPSGNTIQYGYQNGKVTSITLNGSTAILSNVLYQPFGPTRGWTWGNATLHVREYDADGKITDIDSAGLKSYSYDNAFRIIEITDGTDPDLSESYLHDDLDRVIDDGEYVIVYDRNGNRDFVVGAGKFLIYGGPSTNNRITSVEDLESGVRTYYTHDAAGNVTSDGTIIFTYSDIGRMVSATESGVTTVYSLNALGQRVRKATEDASMYFVYDEAGHLIGEYDGQRQPHSGDGLVRRHPGCDTPPERKRRGRVLRPHGSPGHPEEDHETR